MKDYMSYGKSFLRRKFKVGKTQINGSVQFLGLRKTYNSPTMDEERTKVHTFHSKDGKTKATLFGGKADPMAITNEVSNENHQHFTDLIYGPTKMQDPRQSYGGSCAFFQTRDNPEKEMAAAVEGNEANFDVSGRVKDKPYVCPFQDGVDIVNFNEPCFSMPSFSIGLTQMAAAESESCLGTTREEATIPTDIEAPSFKIGLTQLETESLSDGNANVS
ncbi:unnamed protein product [Arabis nemorensis]|uniref:Uncharacterized protein n=1 Tax=Arabis nemorensis TaxID=586526 RepID=A0A565BTQ0_9BRAS|nr:unnamed protein product [Arabis nemorensis]